MSLEILYKCSCTNPVETLDKETGNSFCSFCGGVIPDEDSEMDKLEGMDFDVY